MTPLASYFIHTYIHTYGYKSYCSPQVQSPLWADLQYDFSRNDMLTSGNNICGYFLGTMELL